MRVIGLPNQHLDRLDSIAEDIISGHASRRFDGLSGGEKVYTALAANNVELLAQSGYTIVQALERLEPEWVAELIHRWRFKGTEYHSIRQESRKPIIPQPRPLSLT